ncbi:MAG TPA: hypothetical protein VKI00_22185 [Mycobacterium sp.]|uniref:hypothetical protein n=1 Tax=Mycobacterium sp. TaxID=1785 RepID=UPI002B980E51|nr:hypothetical protein [Mycobacterium sp.]HME78255.1 hypothetical protein [Mycobacterium sp.]
MDGYNYDVAQLATYALSAEEVQGDNETRPRLVAQWYVAPDGRLACLWRTDGQTDPERSS